MRIISGSLRGRRIVSPPGGVVRPTPDRVREAVFNILGQRLDGMSFLDLYAGSGAMGLEAASRGASRVVLVERDLDACAACRESIEGMGVTGRVRLLRGEIPDVLRGAELAGSAFDLVFADPPYSHEPESHAHVLETLIGAGALAGDGTVVLQKRRGTADAEVEGLEMDRPRHYGITSVLIYDRPT